MNNYETLYVLKPILTDEETAGNIAKIEEILVREGAEVLATNKMGMRRLAYPVAKNERGVYVIVYFKSAGSVIKELERNLKFNEEIIKFLTVKYSNKKEVAQFNKLVSASASKSVEKKAPVAEKKPVVTEEPKKDTAKA
jgi:small subunit ribosomal protein S6